MGEKWAGAVGLQPEIPKSDRLLGSKDTTREAFKRGLLDEGEIWMDMIKSRNLTSHIYDEGTARKITEDICARFYARFAALHARFLPLYQQT
jgi:nucleotidyltransferase substrate binding protein (TIGR01987 family)